jgi:hypothetical protein
MTTVACYRKEANYDWIFLACYSFDTALNFCPDASFDNILDRKGISGGVNLRGGERNDKISCLVLNWCYTST